MRTLSWDDPAPTARRLEVAWPLQVLLVAALSFFLYGSLRSELPVDDVLRFTPGIAAGIYEWEASHLLMQPAAVAWHRYLGFGAPARASQESFNAFCAALSLGMFYNLLLHLGARPLRRLVLLAVAALSYNFLSLATSGHIKLAVLPFLVLSLHHGVLWEREVRSGTSRGDGRLAASAVLLGMATAFLVNSAFAAAFLGLAAALVSLQTAAGARRAVLRLARVGLLSGGVAFGLVAGVYALAVPGPATPAGLAGFLTGKAERWPETGGVLESLARGAFGVVQNFVFLGDFGAVVRTWLSGDPGVLDAQGRAVVLALALLFALAGGLLAWVYGGALLRGIRGQGPVVPWAFVLGATAFAVIWSLNEADFYFQITFPTVALMAMAPAGTAAVRRQLLEGAFAVLIAGTVLFGWALPRRDYPLSRYNAELRARLTPEDLAVLWSHWSGGPSLLFMDLPGVPRLYPDHLFYREPDPDTALRLLGTALDRQLARGGRIYVFEILNGRTWNAPWPRLRRGGLKPDRLERFFRERYTVIDAGEMAEIPCWELRPRGAG